MSQPSPAPEPAAKANQPHGERSEIYESTSTSKTAKRSPSPRNITPRSSQKSLPPSTNSKPNPNPTALGAAKTFTTVDEDGIEHIHHASPDHTNVHTECGRHGDDWLFGGWNLGQVVRGLIWGGKK